MRIYTVKNIGALVIGGSLLGLGGCAQMHNWSQSVWSSTKNFSTVSSQKVANLLRPAPQQSEQFATARQSAQMPDTLVADFMRRYAMPIVEKTPTLVAMNHTRENGVHMYRPSAQATSNYIQITPRTAIPAPVYQGPQDNVITPALRPRSTPEFTAQNPEQLAGGLPSTSTATTASYVKSSGGAKMADWQSCQEEAGDIYLPSGSSYQVNPAFDGCMRDKGYLPENEAVRLME